MNTLLETQDVAVAFGGNQAVDGVTLQVEPGELVALIGPNGAGKTTLLNVITGQQAPDDGRVLLDGTDVSRCKPSHAMRSPLFRSYQGGGALPNLSALDNVAIAACTRGHSRREAEEMARDALARVGLTPVMDALAKRLSGGQRVLIDFARLLVSGARVGLFDEPTSGVNPGLLGIMADLIRELARNGGASIVVSHDTQWVFDLCPRVVVMAQGRVLMDDTPDRVKADKRVMEAYLS